MSGFKPTVKVCGSIDEMSAAARQIILGEVQKRANPGRPIVLALSGGSTPKKLYEEMHTHDLGLLKGHSVLFIMGDERLLPSDDEQSNFAMATKALLRDVPAEDVVAVNPSAALETSADEKAGANGAWKVAADYEEKLLHRLSLSQTCEETGVVRPVLMVDVVLLGFGSDGHTASIFPGSIAAQDDDHLVSVSFPSPTMNPKVWRITLSKSVIVNAKHVVVLAGGKDKNWVVHGVLDEHAPERSPVSRFLRDCKGKVTFLLDAGSGEGVSPSS
ncbi:6-phosphogluconolactonase [Leptomonas pyrrhocoris]|uniref:6-phosphogluconolactonase n=1 Tax=Leptomonas pyrrhocoris TaxID=157538 RepID=A0A0M9FQI9_LEPPY|nr:6-phosphogluconolactonase [Leptomonas pyrrhocoris]XP_015652479.1 6-phosphogluconolactonase [Leptomonas pyrrhocoris]KPA74039.1 6-phosphogluconolactonase [Leptomonas pyrrhocoris]KPA74040.1 6-phosphogluconolactonase [Leptomonas pyrrhocoris]|eukprot:XP_015652478.1 6-phosphogluconolactonase [Leptomonas pyrrhocoris]